MRFKSIIAMVLAVLMLASCSDSGQDEQSYNDLMNQIATPTPGPNDDKEQEMRYLTITTGPSSHRYISENVRLYMLEHPDVVITLDVQHGDDSLYGEEKFGDALPVLLMSGQVGDIVHLPSNYNPKVLSGSYFVDLYEYINTDPNFNADDYYMHILTACETDAKLYALCTEFYRQGNFSIRNDISDEYTEKFLSDEATTYSDALNLFLGIVEEQKDAGNTKKWCFEEDFNPMHLFEFSFDKLIDFSNKKTYFTDPEFIALLEQVKTIPINQKQITYSPEKIDTLIYRSSDQPYNDLLAKSKSFVYRGEDLSNEYLSASLFQHSESIFSEPKLLSTEDGNYLFSASGLFAINKNSQEQELAWDFLKFLLRDKEPINEDEVAEAIQRTLSYYSIEAKPGGESESGDNTEEVEKTNGVSIGDLYAILRDYEAKIGYGNPVNKHNCETMWFLNFSYFYNQATKELKWAVYSEEDKDAYLARAMAYITETTNKYNLSDTAYNALRYDYTFIWPDLYLYLTDKQSAEITMMNIANKVELWLNE